MVEGLAVAEDRFRANGTKQYTLRYLYDESNSPVGFGIRYATSSPYWQYYYFGKNIQGDVIALYRSDYNSSSQSYYPTLVATYSYDPWGTPTGIYDANGNAISQTAYHVAAYNPFRYDGDTRLYYLQSRYYDPAIGRFINADGYVSTGQEYNGYNMFAYCNNNPELLEDSGGRIPRYSISVSDGPASPLSKQKKKKPTPKADAYKAKWTYDICKRYGIGAPSGATSVQISVTQGKKTRTWPEYLVGSIPYVAGSCITSVLAAGPYEKVVSALAMFAGLWGIGDNGSPRAGEYKTINVVIEYDLREQLTGTKVHYKEEILYLETYSQNGDVSLYEDRYSPTYFYIG